MAIYEPYGFTTTDNNIRYVNETYGLDVSRMRHDETKLFDEATSTRLNKMIDNMNLSIPYFYRIVGIHCTTVSKSGDNPTPSYFRFLCHHKQHGSDQKTHLFAYKLKDQLETYNARFLEYEWYKDSDHHLHNHGGNERRNVYKKCNQHLIILHLGERLKTLEQLTTSYKKTMTEQAQTISTLTQRVNAQEDKLKRLLQDEETDDDQSPPTVVTSHEFTCDHNEHTHTYKIDAYDKYWVLDAEPLELCEFAVFVKQEGKDRDASSPTWVVLEKVTKGLMEMGLRFPLDIKEFRIEKTHKNKNKTKTISMKKIEQMAKVSIDLNECSDSESDESDDSDDDDSDNDAE